MKPNRSRNPAGSQPRARARRARFLLLFLLAPVAPLGLVLGLRLLQPELRAMGTYATGRKIILLDKFESRGIFYKSFEATGFIATYDKDEKCDDSKDVRGCFTPARSAIKFSVRPETEGGATANFLRLNKGREILIEYAIHRIEPVDLSTSLEVLKAYARRDEPPAAMLRRYVNPGKKTGTREFNVYGRILMLEYRGTVIGTFEGLYFDMRKKKVHPFSITEARMASMARDTMFFVKPMHMGISDAILTGARASSYDIYEINYDEESGAVPAPVKPAESR